jgi:hypothetical protein
MATRTFRGATNSDWNTSTNWLEGSVPTSGDNVFLDALSPSVVLSADAMCDSFNAALFPNSFDYNGKRLSVMVGTATFGSSGVWVVSNPTSELSIGKKVGISTFSAQLSANHTNVIARKLSVGGPTVGGGCVLRSGVRISGDVFVPVNAQLQDGTGGTGIYFVNSTATSWTINASAGVAMECGVNMLSGNAPLVTQLNWGTAGASSGGTGCTIQFAGSQRGTVVACGSSQLRPGQSTTITNAKIDLNGKDFFCHGIIILRHCEFLNLGGRTMSTFTPGSTFTNCLLSSTSAWTFQGFGTNATGSACTIKNCNFSGGGTFTTTGSVDDGGNSNVIFNSPGGGYTAPPVLLGNSGKIKTRGFFHD